MNAIASIAIGFIGSMLVLNADARENNNVSAVDRGEFRIPSAEHSGNQSLPPEYIISESFDELNAAAEKGSPIAAVKLGWSYQNGIGVPKDYERAMSWFEAAANQHDVIAQNFLGLSYLHGIGVPRDFDLAAEYFEEASANGLGVGQFNLASTMLIPICRCFNEMRAVALLEDLVERGDVLANTRLAGLLVKGGENVDRDPSRAYMLASAAADQGFAPGMHLVGWLKHYGVGTEQDMREAEKWFLKAATAGYFESQFEMAMRLWSAEPPQFDRAIAWLELASKSGSSDADSYLARAYITGQGVDINYDDAQSYARKAIKAGNPLGHYILGIMYRRGLGVTSDAEKAFKHTLVAAEGGVDQAMFNVALHYMRGLGTVINQDLAKEWLESSAALGNQRASSMLARLD